MRICPDCQVREVEPRCQYCSECRESRDYFSNLLSKVKWKKSNPEKYKLGYTRQNGTEKHKKLLSNYKKTDRYKILAKKYYHEVTKKLVV